MFAIQIHHYFALRCFSPPDVVLTCRRRRLSSLVLVTVASVPAGRTVHARRRAGTWLSDSALEVLTRGLTSPSGELGPLQSVPPRRHTSHHPRTRSHRHTNNPIVFFSLSDQNAPKSKSIQSDFEFTKVGPTILSSRPFNLYPKSKTLCRFLSTISLSRHSRLMQIKQIRLLQRTFPLSRD